MAKNESTIRETLCEFVSNISGDCVGVGKYFCSVSIGCLIYIRRVPTLALAHFVP